MTSPSLTAILALGVLFLSQHHASPQTEPRSVGSSALAGTTYEAVYRQLMNPEPLADGVATVSDLTIQRDVAQYTLHSGTVYLLSPVGDRTVAAVFLGSGTFRFSPPSQVEEKQLERFTEKQSLEEPFNAAFLIFTDSTTEQLRATLTFGSGAIPDDVADYAETPSST